MPVADDAEVHEVVDPQEAAETAGLTYVNDDEPGLSRHRAGKGFFYKDENGRKVTDRVVLDRIRHLAVPPAYTDVWICRDANGHIQATGRDDRGRKQYRYHPKFREVRDSVKYEHVMQFAAVLPSIRAQVERHMDLRGLPREKVLATVVHLLESTLIRVGNEGYAKDNKSYGLTTLRSRHVEVEGVGVHFEFKGKSNKLWKLDVKDRRAAKVIKACQDLPGQHLFQYVGDDGDRHAISSQDVNAYLHEISGHDITAKDFRTWAGTVLAALALSEFEAFDSQAKAKKNVRAAIERVSAKLGNTATICRKCYVHPEVLSSYMSGEMLIEVKQEVDTELRENLHLLSAEEAAVLAMLEGRLNREIAATKPGRKTARRTAKASAK